MLPTPLLSGASSCLIPAQLRHTCPRRGGSTVTVTVLLFPHTVPNRHPTAFERRERSARVALRVYTGQTGARRRRERGEKGTSSSHRPTPSQALPPAALIPAALFFSVPVRSSYLARKGLMAPAQRRGPAAGGRMGGRRARPPRAGSLLPPRPLLFYSSFLIIILPPFLFFSFFSSWTCCSLRG